MADAIIGKSATDIFDFGSNESLTGAFHALNSSLDHQTQHSETTDADGDVVCFSGAFGEMDDVSVTYGYCGATLGTDIALFKVGSVQNSYLITSITINTSNSEGVRIEVTGHQHDDNAHDTGLAAYSWPSDVVTELNTLTANGKGAVDFFGNSGAAVAVQSSNVAFSCEHEDVSGAGGDHFAGANYKGSMTGSVEYVGTVTALTDTSNWILDSASNSDGAEEFDTSTMTAHRWITRD